MDRYEAIIYFYGKEPVIVDVDESDDLIINDFQLNQNYPNPFNPVTTITYQIPKSTFVTVKVFDVLGRELTTLVNSELERGRYTVTFDGTNFSSGIYFYTMRAGEFVDTKKILLLK